MTIQWLQRFSDDEIIEETKTVTTNLNERNLIYKIKTFITTLRQKWKITKCIINIDSNVELNEIDIKNRTCYYFDDIIRIERFNLDNILIDEKSY